MTRPLRILMVEDNAGDAEFAREALEGAVPTVAIDAVTDGAQAIAYLKRLPPFENADLPDVVLLDLNLPKVDGREVLAEVKRDERLRRIPIVVLTSSDSEQDVRKSYELGANCYVTKPVGLAESVEALTTIARFWLSMVKLP
ncbi:MAG: response regulator [Myxococcota bacterium]|nr:response regulator [Myxococcota bacterium]